jgi:hypothetical protein
MLKPAAREHLASVTSSASAVKGQRGQGLNLLQRTHEPLLAKLLICSIFLEFFCQIIETLLAFAAFVRYPCLPTIEEEALRREAWRVGRVQVGISDAAQDQAGRCDGASLTERWLPLTPVREGGIKRG